MLAVQVPAVRMIAYLRRHLDEALIWLDILHRIKRLCPNIR